MKAVGYRTPGPIDRDDALEDLDLEPPEAVGRDLLVRVQAVSVNPVDTKLRRRRAPDPGQSVILGFDASGVVEAVGPIVEGFEVGDAVFYSGSLTRPGTNSELHLVDERIVARKPSTLDHPHAAALPLTSITAWEMLFERLQVGRPTPEGGSTILVIGGAGGVGSITIQLLRALTDLTVIATASRPETERWARDCGAHHVVDHSRPLAPQVAGLGTDAPGFVFSTTETHRHLQDIADLIAPQGRFGLIDDPPDLDVSSFKKKSVSIHWELMFTRTLFETPDVQRQGELLSEVARLVDAGALRSTLTEVLCPINAENLKKAHTMIESGKARGKIVVEGF